MEQPSVEAYRAAIAANTCTSVDELRTAFEGLNTVPLNLPPGEEAYWTTPRVKGEWRLTANGGQLQTSDEMLLLPMLQSDFEPNAYLNIIPQAVIMHHKVGEVILNCAARMFGHFPAEKGDQFPGGGSLASREHDVPMLIGRVDCVVKRRGSIMQICELDDAASIWPAMPELNPIAESYIAEMERQLGLPIYTAELFQYSLRGALTHPPIPGSTVAVLLAHQLGGASVAELNALEKDLWGMSPNKLRRLYAHNDSRWNGGDINDVFTNPAHRPKLEDVALTVRAYRDMVGFQKHMDEYGPRSITMAWERDTKWPLIPEKLGALAADLDVALDFAREWQIDHEDALLVIKALHGARTAATAVYSRKGTRLKGVSNANHVRTKFGRVGAARGPVVVQPFMEPDTLKTAGIEFIGKGDEDDQSSAYTDRKLVRSRRHIGDNPGQRLVEGNEDNFSMIFRSFVAYLPRERRLVHIGGVAAATDGPIVHAGGHSVAMPLYVDGLRAHRNQSYATIYRAEEMLRKHGHRSLSSLPAGVVLAA